MVVGVDASMGVVLMGNCGCSWEWAWFSWVGLLGRFVWLVLVMGRFGFIGVGFVLLGLIWWFTEVVLLLTLGFVVFGLGSGLGFGSWSLLGFR